MAKEKTPMASKRAEALGRSVASNRQHCVFCQMWIEDRKAHGRRALDAHIASAHPERAIKRDSGDWVPPLA